MTHTRESIEATKPLDRPRVRCVVTVWQRDEDGRCVNSVRQKRAGLVVIDGNNPWVDLGQIGGTQLCERFSWGLVLEILNDPFAAPIHFGTEPIVDV